MEIDPKIFFQDLNLHLKDDQNGPLESIRLLNSLNRSFTEEQVDSSLIDTYLIYIFHTSDGLLHFIETSVKNKNFKKASKEAVEILYTIINNFPTKIPDQDILSIYTLSKKIANSDTDSLVKVKLFELLHLCMEKYDGCSENKNAKSVYEALLKALLHALMQKHSDTVKGKEMAIVGFFAKKYPFYVAEPKKIQQILWMNFEKMMAQPKKISQYILEGFFLGIRYFFESFPLNVEGNEGKKISEKLYKALKTLVVTNEKIKIGNRAALSFLANNIDMYKEKLLEEYKFWHEKLLAWLKFTGLEEKKTGVAVLRPFFQAVAQILDEKEGNDLRKVVEHFNDYSRTVLESKESSNYEKHAAIFCLRQFSAPSHKHLSPDALTALFLALMRNFEATYILNRDSAIEEAEYLPDYVQTVANFMRFKQFSTAELFCLQRAVIDMVKSFHRLPIAHFALVVDSFVMTLFYLKDSRHFDVFLENVVYQGVVWTCSHEHTSNAENAPQKVVTVRNYFPLWNGILKLTSNTSYDKQKLYLDDRKHLLERIVKELVRTALVLVNKLNVAVRLKEDNDVVTDPERAYEVDEGSDYAIFLNVVDFYREMFDKVDAKMLRGCVCRMIGHFVDKCIKYPLVSGFYKLLSYTLKIAKQLALFSAPTPDADDARETLAAFLAILLARMADFKDELAIACLQVLLATPVVVVEGALEACVAPFANVFALGRSYLPLARAGLDALELWQESVDPAVFDPVLRRIIPSLDTFLRSKSLRGFAQAGAERRNRAQRALRKRRVLVELEPELVTLQRRILCFVGKQNLENLRAFVFSDAVGPANLMCGQESHLKVTVPYEDLQVDVYLDTFVPRIIDLSLHCSDRKTRITACELLQAVVMLLLGKARPMNQSGLLELDNTLKTIAAPLLLLGSDVDQVVRQIFAPLFLQLVHWYTSPTQQRGAHSAIIIDAMMEAITHPTNSSLRDFSGKCVKEFVAWTIKQSHEHKPAGDPANVKTLVKHMRFLSAHPDGAKKLGAALIFNNIYREMREEEALVSTFWLEILHIFVQSLNAVEETAAAAQINRSIKNLQRVLAEKPAVFRRPDARRRVPDDLGAGLLEDVAAWALQRTASKSRHCRAASMEIYLCIAPLTGEKKAKINVGELYGDALLEFAACDDVDTLLKWLKSLLCCLEGYDFVAKNDLGDVAGGAELFGQVQVFLERFQNADLAQALSLIARKTWTFSAIDKERLGGLKAACALAIFELFNTVLGDRILREKLTSIWTAEFWRLIGNAVFEPRVLGLSAVLHPGYEDRLLVLIDNVSSKLPEPKVAELVQLLGTRPRGETVFHVFSMFSPHGETGTEQRNLLEGMLFLRGTRLRVEKYAGGAVAKLLADFYAKAEGNVIFVADLQDTTFSYINLVLELALCDDTEFELLVENLHGSFVVQSMECTKEKSFGLYFLSCFGEKLVPVILRQFNRFLTVSLAKNNLKTTMEFIDLVLNYSLKEKSLRIHYKAVADALQEHWHQFQVYFETDKDTMILGLEYLKLLVQINDLHSVEIQQWLTHNLSNSDGSYDLGIFNLLALTATHESDGSQNFMAALQTLAARVTLESCSTKLNKMLTYLPLVRSTTIFRFLADIYVKTSLTAEISPLLTKFIAHRDTNFQQEILEIVYELSCDPQTPFDIRYQIATKFIPPTFHGSDITVLETFFVKHIKDILVKLKERDLQLQIPHFVLTEILFLRVPIDSKDREVCAITNAAGVPRLLRELLAPALKAFELPSDGTPVSRKHKCHAYNALASMVSNCVKLKDFYNKLFSREIDGADVLWRGIVNTAIAYEFAVEFDSIPTQRRVLVNIRDELKRSRREEGASKSLRYIESQRLFASSLSEDVTDFDFTNSVLREKAKEPVVNLQQTVLQLDGTEINDHECMGTVCGLVQHIFDEGVDELPGEDEDDVELPKWMNGIRTTLLNEDTHNNVKIFLVKVIDNMIHIFTHYSKWFLEPLMLFVTNKCAGEGINYFVTDVLIILSKWASTMTNLSEKETAIASGLLKFLVENLKKDRVDIFKYNLDLIKMIVESWKHHLVVPTSTIFELLSSDDSSVIGVNVSSVLLVNGLRCWDEGKEMEFIEVLLKKLKSTKKDVYRPCAETVGLVLRILNDDQFTTRVDVGLKKVNQDYEKYVYCLEGIVRHFPRIVNSFHVSRLINPLNQVPDAQKVIQLQIIFKRVELSLDILEEVSDFKIVDWDQLLESASLEIQIVVLEIIKKCIKVFVTYDNFKNVHKSLTRNVAHPNALFRSCLYDICIEVYNLERDDSGACREMLILGLVDTDADNNEKVMKFWSENTRIPSTVISRFPFLLSNMYKPKIEARFLGFVAYFLMTLSSRSDAYDAPLFDHPLEDCDFEDYKLQTDWRLQHPSVVPMFAETMRSYDDDDGAADADAAFRLRQTQDAFEFAQTQSVRERQLSRFTGPSSSLAVSFDDGFKNPNALVLSQKYRAPRRRFLKDKAKISIGHAHREVSKRVKEVQERIDSAVEKEKRVTIYRSYRKGDFPDIQITLSAVLKPLQVLALHDTEVSRILFTETFTGVVDKAGDDGALLAALAKAVRDIFASSAQYDPSLFGALLDVLLRHKDRVRVDAQTVAYVARESGSAAVGALLLEEYVGGCDGSPSGGKIGAAGRDDGETGYWAKLAELYSELEEWDMVRTIFLDKMNCKEAVQQAIKLESESKFRDAQLLYKQLIETDLSSDKQDFYYDSYFRCFANLGEWEELPKAITAVVEGDNPWHQLWDNGWQQQKLLPWYIKGQVRKTLFTQEWNADFLKDVNECLSDSDKNEYLRGHFSEELCAMWLCQKDVLAANVYLKSCVRSFLDDWQLLNPMFQSLRFQKLLQLQNVIETEGFLDTYERLLDDPEGCLGKYMKRLEKSSGDVLPSVQLNETRLLYRGQFINLLVDKISNIQGVEFRSIATQLQLTKIRMDIDMINAACGFGNYYVARKYFKKYVGKVNPKLQVAYGNIACLKATISDSPQMEVKWSLEGVELLGSVAASTQDQMILLSCSTKMFDVFERLSRTLSDNPDIFEQCKRDLEEKLGQRVSSAGDLQIYAWKQLKSTIEQFRDDSMDCDSYEDRSKYKEISEAYVKLAHFLRSRPPEEDAQADIILCVLRAMKMNSSEARQLFPCILKQTELGGKHKQLFVEETDQIPTWMFLGWIPQLLSSIDASKISAVSKIIMRIAETYPQAIMYPYRLSRTNYDFGNASIKLLTNRLDDLLLKDETVSKFLQALSYVSVPIVILRYYISKMVAADDLAAAKTIQESVKADFFGRKHSSSTESMQGSMFKQIEPFSGEFSKSLGTSLVKMKENLKRTDKQLSDILSNRKTKYSQLLKEYCPWLANFSADKSNVELEIPGQYDGKKMPLTQHHVKISGFHPNVSVMKSLRKPIKVTMLGADTKEYPFLVKFGEDIRQDQRIEQLFGLMNDIFRSDATCSNNGLEILTYQVIPLTFNLGIIQWINDTEPMSEFMKKSLKSEKAKADFGNNSIGEEYSRWLCNGKDALQMYGKSAIKYNRNKVIPFYNSLVNKIPLDIMKTSFWSLSVGTESYVALRANFVASYATLCVGQWLLGIGDRHLNNSLVHLRDGKVLGIDFGHAFGTATQVLPVPELVPFRLTPHLVSLMEPLKERGRFRHRMIDCLRALRLRSAALLATMDVFVAEPSLDWLEHARRVDAGAAGQRWYPERKVAQCRRKLEGVGGAAIVVEDLLAGAKVPEYAEAYVKLALGEREHDARARLGDGRGLTVEEQVDGLIDHATDPNLLGRMYAGWMPWV